MELKELSRRISRYRANVENLQLVRYERKRSVVLIFKHVIL